MYRSRLEAKWAFFMNEVGIAYEYEREYFETPVGGYLPDFYLPEQDIWIEIKPDNPTEHEKSKLRSLNNQVDGRCFFVCSFPTFWNQQLVSGAWILTVDMLRVSVVSIIDDLPDPERIRSMTAIYNASKAFRSRSVADVLSEITYDTYIPKEDQSNE